MGHGGARSNEMGPNVKGPRSVHIVWCRFQKTA